MNNRYREEEKEEMKNSNDTAPSNEENNDSEEVVNPEVEEKVDYVEKYKQANESYLRVLAEMDNYKKRINDERNRERKYASQNLLEKLVNALDIFDKVVSVVPDDEKLKNYLMGFQMINNNLKQILQDEGVKKINSVGAVFDPVFHHAVETIYDDSKEDNIILDEVQSGYMYKDRVLRPALVKVNKKTEDK